MKLLSYNIHFAVGKDERLEIGRIADSLAGADVIALQEVERNWPRFGAGSGLDQPAEIAARLPDYYWAYAPALDLDASETDGAGRVVNRRRQHGVMILARTPLLSARPLPLPKRVYDGTFNMFMGGLEVVTETAAGPLRVYGLHLGYLETPERLDQLETLFTRFHQAPGEGGAWCGPGKIRHEDWSGGRPVPPLPAAAALLGDFNATPGSPEYQRITQDEGLSDAWTAAGHAPQERVTWWVPSSIPDRLDCCLDYCFLTPDLAAKVSAAWIDQGAQGSDHQPVWTELEV